MGQYEFKNRSRPCKTHIDVYVRNNELRDLAISDFDEKGKLDFKKYCTRFKIAESTCKAILSITGVYAHMKNGKIQQEIKNNNNAPEHPCGRTFEEWKVCRHGDCYHLKTMRCKAWERFLLR